MKPYIEEIYRLINLISNYHTMVRRYLDIILGGYLDITPEKIAIKMKAIFINASFVLIIL